MFAPKCLQSTSHIINSLKILGLRYRISSHFPTCFNRIEFRRIWRNELNSNSIFVFFKDIHNHICFMPSSVIKYENIFFAWFEPSNEFLKITAKCETILSFEKIVKKMVCACKSTANGDFLITPEKCPFRLFPFWKPNSFAVSLKLETNFIN